MILKAAKRKLTWKSEFAARWRALDIRFEAYGKDIADSVRINDRICREVLEFEPPSHAAYEMFLDKGGKKISKSAGNVFTPQVWFNYGSPQSLLLLMLKRFVGTRSLDVSDIPAYMNEMDALEDVYFGKKTSRRKRSHAPQRPLPILLRHETASQTQHSRTLQPHGVSCQNGTQRMPKRLRCREAAKLRLPS